MALINLGQDHLLIEYFYDVQGDSDGAVDNADSAVRSPEEFFIGDVSDTDLDIEMHEDTAQEQVHCALPAEGPELNDWYEGLNM